MKTSLSLSYDIAAGEINGLVMGSELLGNLGWLEADCEEYYNIIYAPPLEIGLTMAKVCHLAPLATNPFLLPTLVCHRLVESIGASIDSGFDELHRVEMSSGQTGIGVVGDDGHVLYPGRCEDPSLPVAILGVAQVAIAIEAYVKGHMLTVCSVKDELRKFPWHLLPESERKRSQEQRELIVKHLNWIIQTLRFSQLQVDHLRQRADVQAAAVRYVPVIRSHARAMMLTLHW